MKNPNNFRYLSNELQRLHEFKQPFTKFIETIIYSNNEETHEDMCEFFLLHESEDTFEDIDKELEETALKLARLLELKENQLKEKVLENIKQ